MGANVVWLVGTLAACRGCVVDIRDGISVIFDSVVGGRKINGIMVGCCLASW